MNVIPKHTRYNEELRSTTTTRSDQESDQNLSISTQLYQHGIHYTESEYYQEVEPSTKITLGWELILSVISIQIHSLLSSVLPLLKNKNISFKIVKEKDLAYRINNGEFGPQLIGRILCLYPESADSAKNLFVELDTITKVFKGPEVFGATNLSGIIYARFYDLMNPSKVNSPTNWKERHSKPSLSDYLHTSSEIYLPKNVKWPFPFTQRPTKRRQNILLNGKFYPISLINYNIKGSVFKALYFKNVFSIKSCIVKQGRKNMFEDRFLRTIEDRLDWQEKLFKELGNKIPLPIFIDKFKHGADSYITMEFIDGTTIDNVIESVFSNQTWLHLDIERKQILIGYLKHLILIISEIHKNGYIHRDITPGNFLIDKKGRLYILDLELAYSITHRAPLPPFGLGTPGFMSPEQFSEAEPTVKEDIYAIGALMIVFFTSLPPLKFISDSYLVSASNLSYFTGSHSLTKLITSCLSTDPKNRPSIDSIVKCLETEESTLKSSGNEIIYPIKNKYSTDRIADIIYQSTNWLVDKLNLQIQSFVNTGEDKISRNYFLNNTPLLVNPGTLHFIAKVPLEAFREPTIQILQFHLSHFFRHYEKNQLEISKDFFTGDTEFASALIESLRQPLFIDKQKILSLIEELLLSDRESYDIKQGKSGQGLIILKYLYYLGMQSAENSSLNTKLLGITDSIRRIQLPDGSWRNINENRKTRIGLIDGLSGITLFLISLCKYYKDTDLNQCCIKSIEYISNVIEKSIRNSASNKNLIALNDYSIGTGIAGIVLLYIKSFQVFGNDEYKTSAINLLKRIPRDIVLKKYSLLYGLAGLGEVYMEAYLAFQDEQWLSSAKWIAKLFENTFNMKDNLLGYWHIDHSSEIGTDLYTGNAGIIHFLLRYCQTSDLNIPFIIEPKM